MELQKLRPIHGRDSLYGLQERNLDTNWRDRAMNAALDAEAADGQSEDALLAAIRRGRPGCATMLCWLERKQLLAFLDQKCDGSTNLLRGEDRFYHWEDRGGIFPYNGWYRVRWRGLEIETAMCPGTGNDDPSICIADEPAGLAAFVREAVEFARRPSGRCLRYSSGWASAPDMDAEIGKVTWDDIVLAPETMQQLRAAVEGFQESRHAFQSLDFPWRRGILLIGPPGTGKTMVCKAAAASLPGLAFLYVRDLGEYREREAIRNIFARARAVAPCILAFEDLDGFVVEDNRTVFLNEMDGFSNNEGLLIIASSNHPGKVDEALLRRPSRFDRVFHIGLPGKEERLTYCLRLLKGKEMANRIAPGVDLEALARETAERTAGFTPAYLKELFISAALACAQGGALALDERFCEAIRTEVKALRKQMRRMRNPDDLAEGDCSADAIGIRRYMQI